MQILPADRDRLSISRFGITASLAPLGSTEDLGGPAPIRFPVCCEYMPSAPQSVRPLWGDPFVEQLQNFLARVAHHVAHHAESVVVIRLLIVDDHPAIAEGLVALLDGVSDIAVVGTAQDGVSADALLLTLAPDVVVCDVRLPAADDGLDVLLRHAPQTAFIMLSAHMNPSYVVTAIRHGARGYLSKLAGVDEIVAAIRKVAAGGTAFPDDVRDTVRTSLPRPTAHELSILVPLAQGRSYAEVARQLSLGVRTVESSLRRLYGRYGVTNRVALVRLAHLQGWIDQGR